MSRKTRVQVIVVVSLGFALLLAMAVPIRHALAPYIVEETELKLVAGIIVRALMFCILIYAVKRLNLLDFLGRKSRFGIQQFPPLIIPLIITLMAIFGDLATYQQAGTKLLILFLIANVFVALVEELAFRAIILPLIIQIRSGKKRALLVSVVLTSVIFGVVHYLNLFREPGNFSGITSQVIFASCIGIYLGSLFLRTRNIIFPVMIHFLVNVAFGKSTLMTQSDVVLGEVVEKSTDWASLFITLGLFGSIALGGVFVMRLVNKQDILKSLNPNMNSYEME